MGFTCYCINLRIIASFLRLTMGSQFSASICFCQNNEAWHYDWSVWGVLFNCLHQVLRIDLRFTFCCSGSKIFKNRSKQNSYHACNFIRYYRETRLCLEHLIQMILSHTCKNAMLSPPTKTKVEVNDEGSLHSFICMHDMKNLQNKCEWIAGT